MNKTQYTCFPKWSRKMKKVDITYYSTDVVRKKCNILNFLSINLTTQKKWKKSFKDINYQSSSKKKTEGLNSLISVTETKFTIKTLTTRKTICPNGFNGKI